MLPKFLKLFIITGFFIVISTKAFSQPKFCSLHVAIDNILINKGDIYIALYNNEKDFLKAPFLRRKFSLNQLTNGVLFVGLPAGEYAVTIFQDLNENGVLDKSASLPIEPYGLSNNPNTYPSYSNTRFSVNDNSAITISMKN